MGGDSSWGLSTPREPPHPTGRSPSRHMCPLLLSSGPAAMSLHFYCRSMDTGRGQRAMPGSYLRPPTGTKPLRCPCGRSGREASPAQRRHRDFLPSSAQKSWGSSRLFAFYDQTPHLWMSTNTWLPGVTLRMSVPLGGAGAQVSPFQGQVP